MTAVTNYHKSSGLNQHKFNLLQFWSLEDWSQGSSRRVSCSVVSNSLQPHGLYPTRLLHPWDSPGKSTGVCCHSLLQGIFLTQGSNLGLLQKPGLLHCSPVFYHLSHREANPQQMKDISVLHFRVKEPKKLFKRPPEARLKDSQKLMGPSKAKLNAFRLFTHPNPYQQPALEPPL